MKAGIDKPTKFSLRKERIKMVTTFSLCWVLVYDLQQEVSESFVGSNTLYLRAVLVHMLTLQGQLKIRT